MSICSTFAGLFPTCKSRRVEVDFNGGDVSSDGGVLLLRLADQKLGLTRALRRVLPDPRRRKSVKHSLQKLLRQRIFAIALGYEDLNDHDSLRDDVCFQTGVGQTEPLAGHSSLHRLEQTADRKMAWAMHRVMVDQFIASFESPPEELILDFDATDDPIHGHQEGRFFHGYYDRYCFLPLYVFCGNHLLVALLRPANIDAARHSWAVLALLAKRLRRAWPGVKIVLRADSGFCRWRMLRWCENHGVEYVVGMAKNPRILALVDPIIEKARVQHRRTGHKVRRFSSVRYSAMSWDRERRVIVKAEVTERGSNPRFVVTNRRGRAKKIYTKEYCLRGEAENRIKEQQLWLFSDRTSCHKWWSNQFRLLLSSMAYILVEEIRRSGLRGTAMARAQVNTIRIKLLKIGAVITRNTRRIRIHLAGGYPYKRLFFLVARRLAIE